MPRAPHALLSLALVCGCPAVQPYSCDDASDCDRDSGGGVCLPDSACAYPVPEEQCPSGFIRSPNAASSPEACVPDDGSADTGATCSSLAVHINPNVLGAGEDLVGYPLLLRLDDAALARSIHDNVATLQVTADSGAMVAFELVPRRGEETTFAAWISLPGYLPGETVTIDLLWGGELFPNNSLKVWQEEYVAIWHLDDPLTGVDGDEAKNAISPLDAGIASGTMQPGQAVEGVVGGAWRFDGVDDVLTVGAPFVGTLDSFTVSLWSRFEGNDGDPRSSYFHRLNGEFLLPRCWRLMTGAVSCQYSLSDQDTRSIGDPSARHGPGETVHLALIHDADARTTSMVVNGVLVETLEDPDLPMGSDDFSLEIGRGEWGSANAMIDEFRVSDRALPVGWMTADYLSQSDPAFAVSFGEARAVACP